MGATPWFLLTPPDMKSWIKPWISGPDYAATSATRDEGTWVADRRLFCGRQAAAAARHGTASSDVSPQRLPTTPRTVTDFISIERHK